VIQLARAVQQEISNTFLALARVLALTAIVVESEDLGGTPGAVSNYEAQVGSGGGVTTLLHLFTSHNGTQVSNN
jgi:hypothetical protein